MPPTRRIVSASTLLLVAAGFSAVAYGKVDQKSLADRVQQLSGQVTRDAAGDIVAINLENRMRHAKRLREYLARMDPPKDDFAPAPPTLAVLASRGTGLPFSLPAPKPPGVPAAATTATEAASAHAAEAAEDAHWARAVLQYALQSSEEDERPLEVHVLSHALPDEWQQAGIHHPVRIAAHPIRPVLSADLSFVR